MSDKRECSFRVMSHSSKGQIVHMALEVDQYLVRGQGMCELGLFTKEEKQTHSLLVPRKGRLLKWQLIASK